MTALFNLLILLSFERCIVQTSILEHTWVYTYTILFILLGLKFSVLHQVYASIWLKQDSAEAADQEKEGRWDCSQAN